MPLQDSPSVEEYEKHFEPPPPDTYLEARKKATHALSMPLMLSLPAPPPLPTTPQICCNSL